MVFARSTSMIRLPALLGLALVVAGLGIRPATDANGTITAAAPVRVEPCFLEGTPDAVVNYYSRMLGTSVDPHTDYNLNNQWGSQGTPFTLTWSFVPDGLSIPGGAGEPTAASTLFASMDSKAARATWIAKFQAVFDRWSAVSGIRYTRVKSGANDWDDGSAWGTAGNGTTRGDVRISMHNIDGSSNILAYNQFPGNSDMVLDSGDINLFGGSSGDYVFLRNVVAHEHGHGLGFLHVCPANATKLMEPFISTAYDGPRHDDIRAAMRSYGDTYENNDTAATATNIGTLLQGSPVTFGTVPNPTVGINTTLLSIDALNDVDYFKFTSNLATASVSVTVTPKGLSYDSAAQTSSGCPSGNTINSLTSADLQVQVIDKNGVSVLATANNTAAGGTETVTAPLSSSGTYYIKVSAVTTNGTTQLYLLQASISGCTPPTITLQPQSQSIIVGNTLTLHTNVSGSVFNYTFQWRRNGVNLSDNAFITGAQTRDLTIDPVAFSDTGDYDCQIAEIATGCGATTNLATVNVTDCINFTTQPISSQQICGGDTAVLSVAVNSPAPTYQWRLGTTNLVDGGRISGATTPTLTISNFQSGDAGTNYNCLVNDSTLGCGSASNNAALTYATPVVITQQPASQSFAANDIITLNMNVSGSQFNYIFKWRKDGVDIIDDDVHLYGSNTRQLVIDTAVAGDAGSYDCRAQLISDGCVKYTNAAVLTFSTPCQGDLDGNNVVDLSDLTIALGHYGATGATYAQGDLTGDGNVDLSDISLMLSLYGTVCP